MARHHSEVPFPHLRHMKDVVRLDGAQLFGEFGDGALRLVGTEGLELVGVHAHASVELAQCARRQGVDGAVVDDGGNAFAVVDGVERAVYGNALGDSRQQLVDGDRCCENAHRPGHEAHLVVGHQRLPVEGEVTIIPKHHDVIAGQRELAEGTPVHAPSGIDEEETAATALTAYELFLHLCEAWVLNVGANA